MMGYLARQVNVPRPGKPPTGKRSIVFDKSLGFADMPVIVPCNDCLGCRLDDALQFSIRAHHETQSHEANSALTLTFGDNCPESISKRDVQLFMKRLRKNTGRSDLRYLACGEYGDDLQRPHYHVCLFGFDFSDDRVFFKRSKSGDRLYNSSLLDRTWGFGHATVGTLDFKSACYVAGYAQKKVKGHQAEAYYAGREPEFRLSSTRPAVGRTWFERNWRECMNDQVVLPTGRAVPLPDYYVDLLERISPNDFVRIRSARTRAALEAAKKDPRFVPSLSSREAVSAFKLSKRNSI